MRGLLIALQFMTRIPISYKFQLSEKDLGNSSRYFTLVGFIIGIILFFTYKAGILLLPPVVVGAIVIIMQIIITGGIHLDGFMDTMDGLLSARPKEKVMEIMKDSRVGAHSVTALVALLILKYSIIVSLPKGYAPVFLLLMPVLGRWMLLYCLAFFPYAKKEGLGKIFWQNTSKSCWYLSAIFVLLVFIIFLPIFYLFSILITFLIILTPALIINKHLMGHTGDTYGAINELTEVIFILVCLVLLKF
ncbi:MAG: hypothetical protein VR72_00840 [Clostridiaceae bacterium BRH_c20a]|nr:MAG: hypothetical protein VR72_00840 [Clostridiaceae bacterium BRH_c20a]